MNMNFKGFGNEPPGEGVGGGRLPVNFSLVRQPSVYSLTFDELQSTMGGPGKDFGSMNMDELLKNIWSAEETQTTGNTSVLQEGVGDVTGGHLQRQGSLTLPRTLSQKTVDEVWKDISKEYGEGKDIGGGGGVGGGGVGGSNFPPRQQTLGEMTLEEFLLRAGVVREDAQMNGKSSDAGLFGNLLHSDNNTGFRIGFQQMDETNGLMGNRIPESGNQIAVRSANLPFYVNGIRSTQQQLPTQQQQQQQQQQLLQQHQQLQLQQQQQQQQLFPKQATIAYAPPVPVSSISQLGSPGMRNGLIGISDTATNGNLVQSAGGRGMVGLGTGTVTVATASPGASSDGLGKSNGDTSSVSPVPYMFNGGLRGRKCGPVEKVVERRQRRMIKNRESAARSRARKQAYTMELEAEVAKLKEENQELRKKQ
ncbi:hypothetical protein RJ639_037463, partial [Escallonia herrerae]